MSQPVTAVARRTDPHQHVVGFYETDGYLAASVADFLAPAFDGDGVAVAVATPGHHDRFRAELAARGFDASDPDRYVAFDAPSLLASITVDGRLDQERAETVVAGLLEPYVATGRPIHAYGEMVALLWAAGDVAGALTLDELWNERAEPHRFALMCGYPTSVFADDLDTTSFRAVCDVHSAVLPPEDFSRLQGQDERQRAVAVLQQEAVAGANERQALRRKQEELEAALEQLTEVDRVRRQFVAMVVHDIRNPTVVISGLLDYLREDWPQLDETEVTEYLTTASRNATKIQRLLDDVLLMARIESGQFDYVLTAVDLATTVAEVAAGIAASSGRSVEVEVPARIRPALADEGRQAQVLANLLSNAIKFSAPDTTVSVSVADLGDRLEVRVRDHGVGIAAEDLGKLFRPFSRLAGRGAGEATGTGLGLFISRALVEGQGGSMTVESSPGDGTTFAYTVPTASAPTDERH